MRSVLRAHLPVTLLALALAGGMAPGGAAQQQQPGPSDHAGMNGGGGPGGGQAHGPEYGGGPGRQSHGMFAVAPPGRWWNDPRMVQQLSLTPEQRAKMDSIFTAHRIELIDAVANVEKAETLLDPLVSADTPNENAILAQIDKVAEARAELEKAHARMLLALRAQLNHDQWLKLQADRPPMEGRHGGYGPAENRHDGGAPGDHSGPPPDMN